MVVARFLNDWCVCVRLFMFAFGFRISFVRVLFASFSIYFMGFDPTTLSFHASLPSIQASETSCKHKYIDSSNIYTLTRIHRPLAYESRCFFFKFKIKNEERSWKKIRKKKCLKWKWSHVIRMAKGINVQSSSYLLLAACLRHSLCCCCFGGKKCNINACMSVVKWTEAAIKMNSFEREKQPKREFLKPFQHGSAML